MSVFRNKLFLALFLVGALLLVGCSDLASIELGHEGLAILEVGEEVNLTAAGKSSFNTKADLDDLTWDVSDETVATLDVKSDGVILTAVGEGTVTITVSSGEVSGSLTFEVVDNVPDPVVFFESFEDGIEGEYPAGWIIKGQDVHDAKGTSGGRISTEKASDGSTAVKLVSIPAEEGRITVEFEKPLLYNSLTVDFYQPEGNDNINLELLGENGRVFGLFLTATGNVRYRHPDGGNGSNITNAPNNSWHTAEFQWNDADKIYHAFVNGVRITPPGGSPYETLAYDEQVVKFSAQITKRDSDKVAFIDNIEVKDLAIVEMLRK